MLLERELARSYNGFQESCLKYIFWNFADCVNMKRKRYDERGARSRLDLGTITSRVTFPPNVINNRICCHKECAINYLKRCLQYNRKQTCFSTHNKLHIHNLRSTDLQISLILCINIEITSIYLLARSTYKP